MTALMPSETACLANEDDGQAVRDSSLVQTVWTSPEEIVAFFLYLANLVASEATRSNISLTTEFMFLALVQIPVSGWTCLRTL